MVQGDEVLEMLLPQGGWIITGNNYDGIEFIGAISITREQFEDGFAKVDAWKAKAEAERTAEKSALLAKLGITADEARLLLG